jgi:hypothetical protein
MTQKLSAEFLSSLAKMPEAKLAEWGDKLSQNRFAMLLVMCYYFEPPQTKCEECPHSFLCGLTVEILKLAREFEKGGGTDEEKARGGQNHVVG